MSRMPTFIIAAFTTILTSICFTAKASSDPLVASGDTYAYFQETQFMDDSVHHWIRLFFPKTQGTEPTYKGTHISFIHCSPNSYFFRLMTPYRLKSTVINGRRNIEALVRFGHEKPEKHYFLAEDIVDPDSGFVFNILPEEEKLLLASDSITFQLTASDGSIIAIRYLLEEVRSSYRQMVALCTR